jgi:hypothetical protein
MTTLAIYTVLTGDKEPLGNPIGRLQSIETDLKIEFICFTDNPNLKSNVWNCRVFDTHRLPPEKSSRRPKALPHEYLAEHDYSLYMDNICELKRLPKCSDLLEAPDTDYVYRVFKHSTRIVLAEEALAISSLGYDTAENLINQLDTYVQYLPLQSITPLNTCTILLRQHNHFQVIRHGQMWWEHILNFSKRDQMSFDFCRLQSGLKLNNFEGTKFENNLIHEHNNAAGDRMLASFDKQKFNRLKEDLLKKQSGRDINSQSTEQLKIFATTKPNHLELLSYLTGSSLGNFHAPMHGVAQKLQELLDSLAIRPKIIFGLYCPIKIQQKDSYTYEDFALACETIALFLTASYHRIYRLTECKQLLEELERVDSNTLVCVCNDPKRHKELKFELSNNPELSTKTSLINLNAADIFQDRDIT